MRHYDPTAIEPPRDPPTLRVRVFISYDETAVVVADDANEADVIDAVRDALNIPSDADVEIQSIAHVS